MKMLKAQVQKLKHLHLHKIQPKLSKILCLHLHQQIGHQVVAHVIKPISSYSRNPQYQSPVAPIIPWLAIGYVLLTNGSITGTLRILETICQLIISKMLFDYSYLMDGTKQIYK